MNDEFVRLHMDGGRFKRRTMPVDALPELTAYSQLVVEVAKAIFRKTHPQRQRVPRGFAESLALQLTQFEEGSVVPVLERRPVSDQVALLDNEFERARTAINGAVEATSIQALPPDFPQDLLPLFNRLGRSLRDDEYFLIQPPVGEEVRYDRSVRRRLVQMGGRRYTAPATVVGKVSALDSGTRTFSLRSAADDITVDGQYEPGSWDVLHTAHSDPWQDGNLVRVSGEAEFNEVDHPVRFLEEIDAVAVGSAAWAEQRLDELESLEAGWYGVEGGGQPLASEVANRVRDLITELDAAALQQPRFALMVGGGISSEWSFGVRRIVLEVEDVEDLYLLVFDSSSQEVLEEHETATLEDVIESVRQGQQGVNG